MNILTKEEFFKNQLNIKQQKHTQWSENFAKKQYVKLGCKYILPIDGNEKIKIEKKVKTPDFIIATNPFKIKKLTNKNNFFYIDIKEVTGAQYSNFTLDDNSVKMLIKNLRYSSVGEKQNLLVTEFNEEIIKRLFSQIEKVEDKYGKLRKSGKVGITYVESKEFNQATQLHFLKLITIIFDKLEKCILFNSLNIVKQIKSDILSGQKNELITIVFPLKELFGVKYLSFIHFIGSKLFERLNLFFIDSYNFEKYKFDKDFKWLVRLVNKQNVKIQRIKQ